jgi:CRISPR/Cas system-associated endoribonuclease Cas2
MAKRLRDLINRDEDNVRIYHLCKADIDRIKQLGVGRPVQLMREFRIV